MNKIVKKELKEYEIIVEYSYVVKGSIFVVRFLSGESYSLRVKDLPPKIRKGKPIWQDSVLADDKTEIIIPLSKSKKKMTIPCHIIHSKGRAMI